MSYFCFHTTTLSANTDLCVNDVIRIATYTWNTSRKSIAKSFTVYNNHVCVCVLQLPDQGVHGGGGGVTGEPGGKVTKLQQHSPGESLGRCTWRWSVGTGQLVLAAGSLLNVFLLLLLLSFLILERRYRDHPLPPVRFIPVCCTYCTSQPPARFSLLNSIFVSAMFYATFSFVHHVTIKIQMFDGVSVC